MASSHADSSAQALYLGYGSNLWQAQMRTRCPDSQFLGIARLDDFRWIINDRGYANVIPAPRRENTAAEGDKAGPAETDWGHVVYGLVYKLSTTDEQYLDRNEGVPWAYTKEIMPAKFWPSGHADAQPEEIDVLVYIDRKRTDDDHEPKQEYIYRMNMGIKDAISEGVPEAYIDAVLRRFIPDQDVDDTVRFVAGQQAKSFVDPNVPR